MNHPKYTDYIIHKGWTTEFSNLSTLNSHYFNGELNRCGINLNSKNKVLEIGFGNGEFMRYIKDKNIYIDGVEENPILVQKAIENGFKAILSTDFLSLNNDFYDFIFAFDVIEHISKDDILDYLLELRKKLRKGGIIVLRFPNGDSPLSLVNQNGDITHKNYIGSLQMKYLAQASGYSSIIIRPQYNSIFGRGSVYALFILFRKIAIRFLNCFFWVIFNPKRNIYFFDKNYIAVLYK